MKAEIIHISWASIFKYKGVVIDWHDYLGPTILNSHSYEERNYKNVSLRVWGLVGQFSRLSKDDREQYRIF